MGSPPERTGVLIIRVWTEADPGQGLRARITRSLDITTPGEVVSTASSIDEIVGTVHSWLQSFVMAR